MTKRIERLSDYVTAEEGAKIISDQLGRTIPPDYMFKLSRRKKNPVRTQSMGNRLLYYRPDVETVTIKQKSTNVETEE